MPSWFTTIETTIKNFLVQAADRLHNQRPPNRWKPILFGFAGCILLLLGLITIVSMINQRRGTVSASSRNLANAFQPLAIPAEELFLPDEPDFIPGVLVDRKPKESWTSEDIRPFWTDPATTDPDVWRNRIKTAIDELMEGVP
ncbi:MAG: hypothetical protein LBT13_10795 [Treponema sp.]|jgi:hypothetical protein|nr:hypothetical protein [Treponema sp.]